MWYGNTHLHLYSLAVDDLYSRDTVVKDKGNSLAAVYRGERGEGGEREEGRKGGEREEGREGEGVWSEDK